MMNNRIVILSILAAGILGAAVVAALPIGLVRAPATSAAILKADHSLFDTENGDTGAQCTSSQAFQISASITNFDSVTHAVNVEFRGPSGTLSDLVTYFVLPGQSLTIGGFGVGSSVFSDESNIIAVHVVGAPATPATPVVGWVSAWSPSQPSCITTS